MESSFTSVNSFFISAPVLAANAFCLVYPIFGKRLVLSLALHALPWFSILGCEYKAPANYAKKCKDTIELVSVNPKKKEEQEDIVKSCKTFASTHKLDYKSMFDGDEYPETGEKVIDMTFTPRSKSGKTGESWQSVLRPPCLVAD